MIEVCHKAVQETHCLKRIRRVSSESRGPRKEWTLKARGSVTEGLRLLGWMQCNGRGAGRRIRSRRERAGQGRGKGMSQNVGTGKIEGTSEGLGTRLKKRLVLDLNVSTYCNRN